MNWFVSVVIPMYNEEKYINRCLDSLLTQSYKDFEVILIDDWSTDNTITEAEKYLDKFKLSILKQNHWWPGKARNYWAKESNWEICIFVDADMYFDKYFIEKLIKPIIDWKEIWTCHWTELVWNINNPIARAYWLHRLSYNNIIPRSWVFRAILKSSFLEIWWYDSKKYAFEDDFSKFWTALYIEDAICYHNNQESLWEIFNHEVWIWESLVAKWKFKEYINKYKSWLFATIALLIMWTFIFYIQWIFKFVLVLCLFILIIITLIKWIQRTVKEWYLSHILFVPLVMTTRWLWYGIWIIKYYFKK